MKVTCTYENETTSHIEGQTEGPETRCVLEQENCSENLELWMLINLISNTTFGQVVLSQIIIHSWVSVQTAALGSLFISPPEECHLERTDSLFINWPHSVCVHIAGYPQARAVSVLSLMNRNKGNWHQTWRMLSNHTFLLHVCVALSDILIDVL